MKYSLFFILSLLIVSGLLSCSPEKNADKPNVVIIFLDDSGWSDFEPFGEEHLESPNVMQLAAEGCAFFKLLRASGGMFRFPFCPVERLLSGSNQSFWRSRTQCMGS